MAFQGYTQETVDFLWGIRFNNERGWFMEHKQDYQAHLLAPTRALAEQVYDAILVTFVHWCITEHCCASHKPLYFQWLWGSRREKRRGG